MTPMDTANGERIDSWKHISAYLGRDVSTVIRWEKEKGLPVHRIPGGRRQSVFAYRHELDRWIAGSDQSNNIGLSQAAGAGLVATVEEAPLAQAQVTRIPEPSSIPRLNRRRRAIYAAAGFLAALVLLSAYRPVNSLMSFRAPELIGQRQLTANGLEKSGLLTNRRTIYFGQEQNGWFALAEMPVDGGPVHVLWNPQANVRPIDVSPDGKELLALCGKGVAEERELWIVPLGSGEPRRLPNIAAHSAAWAPGGKAIAYASGTGVYLTSPDGMAPKEIGFFARIPRALSWSSDGDSLRFVLDGLFEGKGIYWGQLSGDGMKNLAMRPLPPTLDWNREWAPISGKDAYFVWKGMHDLKQTQLWQVRSGTRWWQPQIQVAPVPFVQGDLYGLAFSPETSCLLALSRPKERASFVRFDPRLQSFRQILPGASGTFLNYSRDGKWVAYVSYQENSLWISRSDGSGSRQLTSPPDIVELPRWSPDGKRIAYMAYRSGSPWRIKILDVETGITREAAEGDDSQGAPTWSPDGRFISYGGLNCEQTHSCAIHRINLATGKVQTLPDSDGLFTARWSPDGRFIAALQLEQHQLMLFDVSAGTWHKLADEIDGADLSWSANSEYLYTAIPGAARIVRIHVADGRQETVLDVRAQDSLNLAENEDLQFSIAPDDSVVLHRQIHSPEIFAFDVREN